MERLSELRVGTTYLFQFLLSHLRPSLHRALELSIIGNALGDPAQPRSGYKDAEVSSMDERDQPLYPPAIIGVLAWKFCQHQLFFAKQLHIETHNQADYA